MSNQNAARAREPDPRQDEFAGHGMGLATVSRIVQRHGGRIEAEGAVGQGATVRFWLPRPD